MNSSDLLRPIVIVVAGAVGSWLLLPHRHGRIKPAQSTIVGAALTAVAILVLASLWRVPGSFFGGAFFYAFSLVALGSAVLTITSRNPVYSALWFAAVVLSTSGLFLLAGAQFLAAGTIIVYAGAIIVTFLFVLMLAQSEGRATYDRMARSPARATMTCFLLFWSLLYALMIVKAGPDNYVPEAGRDDYRLVRGSRLLRAFSIQASSPIMPVYGRALSETGRLGDTGGGPALGRHVAGLGGTLYTDHLVTVELAGALLFAALIGALAIATPKPPVRPAASKGAGPTAS